MFCQKNHRRQCRRKFFSCDESRRLSSQKSGDIVLFQHAFWMSDFFDECCPPSSKNMWGAGRDVVMSCFFWWMLATFIKKNTLSVDRDVVIAHFFWWMQATFIKKKVVIFKGRDFDVHICLCSSLDPSFFWWWFNYRISYRDFQWEHGFHVFFLYSMFFLALPGCSVEASWDSGPNL